MPLVEQRPQQGLSAAAPQTWGQLATSFGKHVAGLPLEMLKGAYGAVTLPSRAYRGEVTQDDMLPEAMNFAGNVTLGGYMMPKPANALGSAGGGKGITAYHGSPHDFDRFDMSKIGTGEGAQAYGHGLYFADSEAVAQTYRDNLSKWSTYPEEIARNALRESGGDAARAIAELQSVKKDALQLNDPDHFALMDQSIAAIQAGNIAGDGYKKGRMYEVRINAEPDEFLDWDKPLSQQSEAVKNRIEPALRRAADDMGKGAAPETIAAFKAMGLDDIAERMGPKQIDPWSLDVKDLAQQYPNALRDAGIPGTRYLDQGSRTAGEGSRNYVVFDDKLVEILRKYGLIGALGGGATAAGLSQPNAESFY